MSLPAYVRRERKMIMPSTGKETIFYSLTTGDETELAMIKKDADVKMSKIKDDDKQADEKRAIVLEDMTKMILSVVKKCFPSDFNEKRVTEADFSAIMLELKRESFGNLLELQVSCPKCYQKNIIKIDLNKVQIDIANSDNKVEFEGSEFYLQYPSFLESFEFNRMFSGKFMSAENLSITMALCIDKYKPKIGEIVDIGSAPLKDRIEFVKTLPNDFLSTCAKYVLQPYGVKPMMMFVEHCQNFISADNQSYSRKEYEEIMKLNAEKEARGEDPLDLELTQCGHTYSHEVNTVFNFFL